MQTACETTASAQYSLARTCEDCKEAYKAWLCSVSIPRCTDYTSTLSWLQPRALGQPFPNGTFLPQATLELANNTLSINGSRNQSIDQIIQPGPYKEILPCDEICYSLVQSCPSSIGFECPQPHYDFFNESYGVKPLGGFDANGRNQNITCNYPGLVYFVSAGVRGGLVPSLLLLMMMVAGVVMGVLL